MLFTLAVLSASAWAYLIGLHGRFWRSGPFLDEQAPSENPASVAVVVPARDEAEHIAQSLTSLLAQNVAAKLHIVVVDDNSSDGTGEISRQVGAGDPRLTVVAGSPLPSGWSGKMWAVSQGLARPEVCGADYVLLTDADIVHAPGHLAALLAQAATGIDLVSEMVQLRCDSFPERATIPAFVFFFQMLYPFRWVASAERSTAAAAGGTMLVSRRALDTIGGVDRICTALIDDVALAREVKGAGYSTWLGHSRLAFSERRYPSFDDVWSMIARTAYVQLRYSPLLLAGTCVGMSILYLAPACAAIGGRGLTRWTGIAVWAAMAGSFQPTLRVYRRNPLWGFALPAIAAFYVAATCGSALRFYRGNGGQWKNRSYAPPATPVLD